MYDDDDDEKMTPEEHNKIVADAYNRIKESNSRKIDYVNISPTVEQFKMLADLLKGKVFQRIDLSCNDLTSAYMESLQQIIINNPELKEISLEANRLDDDAIVKLVDNSEVAKRLSNIHIKFAIYFYSDKGFFAAAQCMSPSTVLMMNCVPGFKNKEAINAHCKMLEDELRKQREVALQTSQMFHPKKLPHENVDEQDASRRSTVTGSISSSQGKLTNSSNSSTPDSPGTPSNNSSTGFKKI